MQHKYPFQKLFTCCLGIFLSFWLFAPAIARNSKQPQIEMPASYRAARARVSLVPKEVFFRASPDEISIWQVGCVFSSVGQESAADALKLIRAHQLHSRPSDERFEVRNAIEVTTLENDSIVILFSEVLHQPGKPDFVRGEYREKRRFLTQKFETDSSFVNAVRSWALFPPVQTLTLTSPDTCNSRSLEREETLLPPSTF